MKQSPVLTISSTTPSLEEKKYCTNFKPLFTVESASSFSLFFRISTFIGERSVGRYFARLGLVHFYNAPGPNTCQIFGACCLGMSIHPSAS